MSQSTRTDDKINRFLLYLQAGILMLFCFASYPAAGQDHAGDYWKAGVAREVITPAEPMWMAGYASRDSPSQGSLHDLWAKAIVLEDPSGKKVILVTTDLLGFPANISDNIVARLSADYGFGRPDIILSSSHTHSGPVLWGSLFDIYPLDDIQKELIDKYSRELEERIAGLAEQALRSLAPAHLYSANGVVRFQVNRRNNNASTLHTQSELKGPNDHAVPVIKVTDTTGMPFAVIFGYACHPTVLDVNRFSGDYAGFAQIELENLYPGVTAMFFQGAGADQNPLPRRTIPLAEQYGKELAAAVDRVLNEEMKELDPEIASARIKVDIELTGPPGEEELRDLMARTSGYQHRWASRQLAEIENRILPPSFYPFPIQIWRLGEQLIMVMGGEPVISYAIELKKIFGHDIFVMGYANDVMGYVPSETILEEGGYEGDQSQMVYGLPSKWAPGIEKKILDGFRRLASFPGISQEKEYESPYGGTVR